MNILVVEDEFLVAKDLISRLQSEGYRITDHVKNGEDALASAAKSLPDVVLMDIDIEGKMSGIDTAKALNRHQRLPIIYLTKFKDDQTFDAAKKTGPCHFINKPVSQIALSRAIQMAVEQFRLFKESTTANKPGFSLKVDGKYQPILLESVLWITAEGPYCHLHTLGESLLFSKNMSALLDEIDEQVAPPSGLLRIHRSTVVNTQHIDAVNTQGVTVQGITKPIGKTYLASVRKVLKF